MNPVYEREFLLAGIGLRRRELQKELEDLDQYAATLTAAPPAPSEKPTRVLSEAAKRKMSLAAKRRWAVIKASKKAEKADKAEK